MPVKRTIDPDTRSLRPYGKEEIHILREISAACSRLWEVHARHLAEARRRTTDPLAVFGQEDNTHVKMELEFKDNVYNREIFSSSILSICKNCPWGSILLKK